MDNIETIHTFMLNKQKVLHALEIDLVYWTEQDKALLGEFEGSVKGAFISVAKNRMRFKKSLRAHTLFSDQFCAFCLLHGLYGRKCSSCKYASKYGECTKEGSAWSQICMRLPEARVMVDGIFSRDYVACIKEIA